MFGQIPWAANLLFLMTLTLMCDPRSENELFSLKLLKGLDLHISVDWWQHIHTRKQKYTASWVWLIPYLSAALTPTSMRICVDTYKYTHYRTHLQMPKHSYIHTNMHTHAHTHTHTLQGIYQETQRSASGPLGDPGSWLNWPTVAAKPCFLPPETLPAYRLVKISLSFLHVCV